MKVTIEIEDDDDEGISVSSSESAAVTDEIPDIPEGQLQAGRLSTMSSGSSGFDPVGLSDEPFPEQRDVGGPDTAAGRMDVGSSGVPGPGTETQAGRGSPSLGGTNQNLNLYQENGPLDNRP